MKKFKTVLSIVLLLLFLCQSGCGEKAVPFRAEDAAALLNAGVFDGDMAPVDGEMLLLLYGIDPDTVTSCAGYRAVNAAASADEVTVLILTDEDAAEAAERACRKHVENQIKTCRNYCPAAVPRLEAAVVCRVENTVLLAVGDPDRLSDAVKQLHHNMADAS